MDAVTGINKADAMMMLIRTASPQVIVTDEIGRNEDAAAILEAARCGIGLIATMHGGEFEAMLARPVFRMLAQSGVVDRFILLGRRGTCDGVWDGSGHRCQLTEG